MSFFAFLNTLITAATIVGGLVLLRVADVPRVRRHQQFLMPAIAVVFAVAVLILLYRFNARLDSFLAWLFDLLPFLLPLYQSQWLYLIYNGAIILTFLGVKYLYLPIARLFAGEQFLGSTLVSQFYQYDPASGRWFVKQHLSQLRMLLCVLFWTAIGICFVLFFMMRAAPHLPIFTAISYPAVAVLVLGEFWAALNGMTRDEARDLIAGERDKAKRIVNYAALREVFRKTFPGRLIDEGVDLANAHSRPSRRALQELARSESNTEQLFAEYFGQAKQSGDDVDESLMHASLGLLNGKSTLINSPFYADLTDYLTLPSYIKLLNGGKCLIVVGRDSTVDDVLRWFSDGLEKISGVPGLWDVQSLKQEASEDLDVGVLRAADLHNLELLGANDGFFKSVETVLLIEPSRMLATGQLGLSVVVSRLMRGEPAVYAAVDHNHDGLVDALSHLLKVNLTDVVATQLSLGASSELVWKTEGSPLAAQILPGVSRYLGMGTEIAALAWKYHVSEVEWVGGDRFPVTDMSWIAGQYYSKLTSFAELEPSQRSITTALKAHSNPYGVTRSERRFLVVEDEMRNVYETLRLYASRSTESGFINVLSDNYLMRDYMVDNRELFSTDAKAIPAIVPDHVRSGRNTLLKLIMMLSEFEVPESTILRELELTGIVPSGSDTEQTDVIERPVARLMNRLSQHYFGRELRLRRKAAASSREPAEPRFTIDRGSGFDDVLRQLGSAYFLVEDETEQRDFIGACLYGHLEQTVLPGQFVTFGGKHYQVQSIGTGSDQEEVVLRRAAEHITGRPAYRVLRSYVMTKDKPAVTQVVPVTSDAITVERRSIEFTSQTLGYLESVSRDAIDGAKRVELSGLLPREYLEKSALRLRMHGASSEVRRTITLLLNELFVTVFPTGHQFVVAVTEDAEREFGDLLPEFAGGDADSIFILEDSLVDLGLLVAVERNWQRMLEIITDYLDWLQAPRRESEPTASSDVTFEGESTQERAERARRVSEAEARGSYTKPKKPSLWQRISGNKEGQQGAGPSDARQGDPERTEVGLTGTEQQEAQNGGSLSGGFRQQHVQPYIGPTHGDSPGAVSDVANPDSSLSSPQEQQRWSGVGSEQGADSVQTAEPAQVPEPTRDSDSTFEEPDRQFETSAETSSSEAARFADDPYSADSIADDSPAYPTGTEPGHPLEEQGHVGTQFQHSEHTESPKSTEQDEEESDAQ